MELVWSWKAAAHKSEAMIINAHFLNFTHWTCLIQYTTYYFSSFWLWRKNWCKKTCSLLCNLPPVQKKCIFRNQIFWLPAALRIWKGIDTLESFINSMLLVNGIILFTCRTILNFTDFSMWTKTPVQDYSLYFITLITVPGKHYFRLISCKISFIYNMENYNWPLKG